MSTLETVMMATFVLALGFNGWKLYAFLPTKPLKDDDTTSVSVETLKTIMYDVIHSGELDEEAIVTKMKEHPKFDHDHFWRFNHNRLKQLLNSHFLEHPHHQNIEHIHDHLTGKDQSVSK